MTRIDPTLTIEYMARRFRQEGVSNPVAAAVALAARGHTRLDQLDFATNIGESVEHVGSTERGEIAYSDLPPDVGIAAAESGADLLALVDLENEWRHQAPGRAAHK